ncbi:MAG: RagB/SusD family nutrient uptake outer membrane protein [Tannerella sp.]|jgi:hypothetical protein|nr:RagB/SusD family nutrient uptake outer membrane protein [Tannerella sp.]
MKNILTISLMVVLTLSFNSCGDDFLLEEQTTKYSTEHFETEEGITALATGLYGNLRGNFNREAAYTYHLSGTDEFVSGTDPVNQGWNSYEAGFGSVLTYPGIGSNTAAINEMWDEMYVGIANANLVIANADYVSNEDTRNKCLGEAYFMRGFNYYHLFAQWGGVPVIRERLAGVQRNFERASEEETLNAIIEDFQQAYNLLPTDRWRGVGTITKYAAAHFLAKALLYRASERCEPWGAATKTEDLAKCISLCDEVIAACPLESDYWNLYGFYDRVDAAIESSREVLLSAQFNANSNGRFRNYTNQYFECVFHTFAAGFVNRELANIGIARNFARCVPTEYNYSTYDNVNDARMWKTFRTVYGVNNAAALTNVLNLSFGDKAVALGDRAIVFILNKKGETRFDGVQFGRPLGDANGPFTTGLNSQKGSNFIHPETGKWVPCAIPLFLGNDFVMRSYSGTDAAPASQANAYPSINKTLDGSQLTSNDQGGNRDGVIARTGETYLIKAEAQVRQGEYSAAIATVNVLRKRAEWKAGEDRELYVDGSIAVKNNANFNSEANQVNFKNSNPGYPISREGKEYLSRNTYILSTGYTRPANPDNYPASNLQISNYTTLPPEDEAILAQLGVSGDYDRMLNFIFNERTRELDGEFNRWEELSRTKLLVKRTKLFNFLAAPNIQEYHNLRPIPQTFIDGLLNEDGSNLTDEQKKSMQNPGY